ncbi:MAG: hypothetical protein AB7H66_10920 [Hyphomonadaceae bacterium]
MRSRRELIVSLWTASLACVASACVSKPVAGLGVGVEGPQRIEVARGDSLRILTRDGRRRTIRVERADTSALYSARETIPIADLVFVERNEFAAREATLAGGAVVLVVLLAPAIEAAGAAAVWAAAVPN